MARKRYDDFIAKNPKSSLACLQAAGFLAVTGGKAKDIQAMLERGWRPVRPAMPIKRACPAFWWKRRHEACADAGQEASVAAPDDPVRA